jgi:hypothetical protein
MQIPNELENQRRRNNAPLDEFLVYSSSSPPDQREYELSHILHGRCSVLFTTKCKGKADHESWTPDRQERSWQN